MNTRPLGKTGLKVSEIGYGTWGMGGTWWGGPMDDLAIPALQRALELDVNFIDTALAYGDGHSERLIGKVLRETRSQAIVATKAPPKDYQWPAKNPNILKAFPKKWLAECVEKSLKNLGLDRVDLIQLHVWHKEWAGQDEWRESMGQLKSQGKIRFFGVSINDHDPDSALDLVKTGAVDSVQVIYNLFDPSPAERLLPACEKAGVGVIVRCPLDEGGLSGKLTTKTTFPKGDFRASYFKGSRLKETVERVDALTFLIRDEIRSMPQAALKFALSHPAVSTVIPGMRRREHVEENCAVSDGIPLRPEDLERVKPHAWPRNFYGG